MLNRSLRDDMTVLLSKAGNKLTVKQLLDTLQETQDFESSMARKYATPVWYYLSFGLIIYFLTLQYRLKIS